MQEQLTSSEVESLLQQCEDELRQLRGQEKAFVYDTAGNLLVERIGSADQIQFGSEDIETMQNAKGAIFLHNHPGGWNYPPTNIQHSGRSFSRSDMILAAGIKLAEMRAITPRIRFSLRPPIAGWEGITPQDIADAYDLLTSEVRVELIHAVSNGEMTLEEANFWSEHERCKRVAESLGLQYTWAEE